MSVVKHRNITAALVSIALLSLAAEAGSCRCILNQVSTSANHLLPESPACCCCPLPQDAVCHLPENSPADGTHGSCSCPCDGGSCHCALRNREQAPALPSHTSFSSLEKPETVVAAVFSVEIPDTHSRPSLEAFHPPPPSHSFHLFNCVFLC